MHLTGTTDWRRAIPTRATPEPWRRLTAVGLAVAFLLLALLAFTLPGAESIASALRLPAVIALSMGTGIALRTMWPSTTPLAYEGGNSDLTSAARRLSAPPYAGNLMHTHQQLNQARSALEQNYMATLESLAGTVDAHDPDTYGHCRRVAGLASLIGHEMGLAEEDCLSLKRAALLHDIGKLGVPDSTLWKTTPLTREDAESIKHHPELGYRMLSGLRFLGDGLSAIRYHHERFDGSGYPHGLVRNQIPLMARILAVADAYDAITSDRPYRLGRSRAQGLEEIVRCSGSHFDPAVVAALLHTVGQPSWAVSEASMADTGVSTKRTDPNTPEHDSQPRVTSILPRLLAAGSRR